MKRNILLTAFAAIALSGCVSSYDINVRLSPTLKELYGVYPALEVDVIGVDQNELERFEATPVDDYFAIGSALRGATPHATLRFRSDDTKMHSLSRWDDVWDLFDPKDPENVVVLVNLPPLPGELKKAAAGAAKPKTKDGRRLVIPLENHLPFLCPWWYFTSNVRNFEITPAGINIIKD